MSRDTGQLYPFQNEKSFQLPRPTGLRPGQVTIQPARPNRKSPYSHEFHSGFLFRRQGHREAGTEEDELPSLAHSPEACNGQGWVWANRRAGSSTQASRVDDQHPGLSSYEWGWGQGANPGSGVLGTRRRAGPEPGAPGPRAGGCGCPRTDGAGREQGTSENAQAEGFVPGETPHQTCPQDTWLLPR